MSEDYLQIVLREKDLDQFPGPVQEALMRLAYQQEGERREAPPRDKGGFKGGEVVATADEMRDLASSQYNRDGTRMPIELMEGDAPWRKPDRDA